MTVGPSTYEPESTLLQVVATPEPPGPSVAKKVRVTDVLCQRSSLPETRVVGGVVSVGVVV